MKAEERAAQIAKRQKTILLELLPRVEAAVQKGIPADRFLRKEFQRNRHYGSRDRRFISNAIFSWFRWKGWLDQVADLPLEKRISSAFFLDAPSGHPALEPVPSLPAEPVPDPYRSPDLFLGQKTARFGRYLNLPRPPTLEPLLPSGTMLLFDFPPQDPAASIRLLAAFQNRPPIWIRVRPEFEQNLEKEADHLQIRFQKDRRIPFAWALPPEGDNLRLLAARCPGAFEVQDIASQLVALSADPQPDESWWDVCAGAGGKTLHLADLVHGNIRLFATDRRAGALREAKRRAARSPYGNRIRWELRDVLNASGAAEVFDGVLVDAPCSGSGVWSREPDARWRFAPTRLPELTECQFRLLQMAARAVRPGGRLLYATCSLFRTENFLLLERFLSHHPDFILHPFPHPLTSRPTPGCFYVWPWEGPGDGFFIARLVRKPDSP